MERYGIPGGPAIKLEKAILQLKGKTAPTVAPPQTQTDYEQIFLNWLPVVFACLTVVATLLVFRISSLPTVLMRLPESSYRLVHGHLRQSIKSPTHRFLAFLLLLALEIFAVFVALCSFKKFIVR